jgi:hypothetical protein
VGRIKTRLELQMTEAHDDCCTHVADDERLALSIEEGALLWCMRMLVVGMKRGVGAATRVDEILEALGAPSASACLRAFLVALSRGCTRMIEVRCICQPRLDADERALLDVLCLAQAMRPFEALLLLRGFVTQGSADEALRAAESVGAALAQAGCFLPVPEEEVRLLAMTQAAPTARADLKSLH